MSPNSNILVVEGSSSQRDSLTPMLQKAGYETHTVSTGREALEWLEDASPDLVVFDASSMRSNGVRVCRRIRRARENTPLIHSRAVGDEEDRSAEADVYLERPYTSRKLLNRVRALLPANSNEEEIVRYGFLTLFRNKRSVEVAGRGEYTLTPKLALLLETFVRHPNELMTRRKLMELVWHTDFIGDTRTIDVHVRWLRECIEDEPSNPKLLKTVRGKGYYLNISPDGS